MSKCRSSSGREPGCFDLVWTKQRNYLKCKSLKKLVSYLTKYTQTISLTSLCVHICLETSQIRCVVKLNVRYSDHTIKYKTSAPTSMVIQLDLTCKTDKSISSISSADCVCIILQFTPKKYQVKFQFHSTLSIYLKLGGGGVQQSAAVTHLYFFKPYI